MVTIKGDVWPVGEESYRPQREGQWSGKDRKNCLLNPRPRVFEVQARTEPRKLSIATLAPNFDLLGK